MIEYLALIFVLPFLPLNIIPFIFAFLVIKAERIGIDYSKEEVLLYALFPLIPSFASGFEKYFFFMAYFMSIMLSMKIASKSDEKTKIKELNLMFGEKTAKEVLFVIFFLTILKEKFKRAYITAYIRRSVSPTKMITKLTYYLNEKAKRMAISKALRE